LQTRLMLMYDDDCVEEESFIDLTKQKTEPNFMEAAQHYFATLNDDELLRNALRSANSEDRLAKANNNLFYDREIRTLSEDSREHMRGTIVEQWSEEPTPINQAL